MAVCLPLAASSGAGQDEGCPKAPSLSEMECRRVGLSFPCWIILDEYNRVELDKAFDFDSTKPIGSVSAAFLEKIAMVIKQASASRQVKGVNRS